VHEHPSQHPLSNSRTDGRARRPGRGQHLDHGPPLRLRPPRGPRRPHACRTGWPGLTACRLCNPTG